MAEPIHLELVTPSRRVASVDCEEVYIPGTQGELGVLPGHAALVATVGSGILRYRSQGQPHKIAVRGGFAHVLDNHVTVMADQALLPNKINKTAVVAEQARVEKKILEPEVTPEERDQVFAERDWLLAQTAATA